MEDVDPEDRDVETYEKVVDIFRKADRNGDGQIDQLEFAAVFMGLRPGVWTYEKLAKMWSQADVNHDGTISYEEFASWLFLGSVDQEAFCEELGTDLPSGMPSPQSRPLAQGEAEEDDAPKRRGALIAPEGEFWPERPLYRADLPREIGSSLEVSSAGLIACGCQSGFVYLLELESGHQFKALVPPESSRRADHPEVNAVRFSPNGDRLAVGADVLHLWTSTRHVNKSVAPGTYLGSLAHNRKHTIRDCAWRNDELNMVAAMGDASKIWTLEMPTTTQVKGKITSVLRPKRPYLVNACCYVGPDEVISAGADKRFTIWKDGGRAGWRTAPAPSGHDGHIHCCCASPCGRFLLTTSSDRTPQVMDLESKKPLQRLVGHEDWVTTGAFCVGLADHRVPPPLLVATGSNDKTARVWDAQSGRCLARVATEDDVTGVALVAADGSSLRLLTLHAQGLDAWDLSPLLQHR